MKKRFVFEKHLLYEVSEKVSLACLHCHYFHIMSIKSDVMGVGEVSSVHSPVCTCSLIQHEFVMLTQF